MSKQLVVIFPIFLVLAACGSNTANSRSSGVADPNQNPACGYLPLALPLVQALCGYASLDPNAVESVCNDPNATSVLPVQCYGTDANGSCGGCGLQPLTGTWRVVGTSATHLVAQFDCQGSLSGLSWSCTQQSATVSFADGSQRSYKGANPDPNHDALAPTLNGCNPFALTTTLAAGDGSGLTVTLDVPSNAFAPGKVPVVPSDSNTASVGVLLTPAALTGAYAGGTVTGGSVAFAATSYDPNERLAFGIDVTLAAPAQDIEQPVQTIFCGQSSERYHGEWLIFVPNP